MKRQGRLVRWEAERGFGFICSPEVLADVFVHLRDFSDRRVLPQVGMTLSFEESSSEERKTA
jgi:cold shock CspA family protein